MEHVALYRRYRPKTFDEIVGQSGTTSVLKKQIQTNKICHAYIFSGTRGTGKTSSAKVFARAINCANPQNGEPCNECEACLSILNGECTDVVEMDAASNNSVENIRAIRQEVAYATCGYKYKVYIIDEAHMLSTSAFNALLKTLEEPPQGVVFILATTEEHKILPTILSRCVRFEFKKLSVADITERLKLILEDISVTFEEDAVKYIASLADGAMRDALSILERCIDTDTNSVTYKNVEKVIGVVERDIIDKLVLAILEYDISTVKQNVDYILDSGKELRYCTDEIVNAFLNKLVSSNLKDEAMASRISGIIKELLELDDALRQSVNQTVLFKAKLLFLATKPVVLNLDEYIDKITELELRIKQLESEEKPKYIPSVEETKTVEVKVQSSQEEKEKEEPKTQKADKPIAKTLFKGLDEVIKKAADTDNLRLYSALTGVKAYVAENDLYIQTQNSFAYGLLRKDELKTNLKDIVIEVTGKEYNINIVYEEPRKKENLSKFEEAMKDNGVNVEIVD